MPLLLWSDRLFILLSHWKWHTESHDRSFQVLWLYLGLKLFSVWCVGTRRWHQMGSFPSETTQTNLINSFIPCVTVCVRVEPLLSSLPVTWCPHSASDWVHADMRKLFLSPALRRTPSHNQFAVWKQAFGDYVRGTKGCSLSLILFYNVEKSSTKYITAFLFKDVTMVTVNVLVFKLLYTKKK